MRGQEVSNRMVRELLRTARRRGYDEAALLAGLSFDAAKVADPRGFCAWDDYVVFLDRLQEATGGPERMEDLASEMIALGALARLIARHLVSPIQLYSVLAEWLGRVMYSMVGVRHEVLPDGRIEATMRIPLEYRGSTAFHRGTLGCYRIYPTLLDLPPAVVEGTFSPHEARFVITPPPPETLLTRATSYLTPRLAQWLQTARFTEQDAFDALDVVGQVGRDPGTKALGRRLAEQADFKSLAAETLAGLQRRFLCTHAKVHARNAMGQLELIGSLGDPGEPNHQMTVGQVALGKIEADLGLGNEHGVPWIDGLMPWFAIGVERCLQAARASTTSGESPVPDLGALVDQFAARWELTHRQAEVLTLLVGGAPNREIASACGVTVKTAEAHVGQILTKAGAVSRAEVVSLILRGG